MDSSPVPHSTGTGNSSEAGDRIRGVPHSFILSAYEFLPPGTFCWLRDDESWDIGGTWSSSGVKEDEASGSSDRRQAVSVEDDIEAYPFPSPSCPLACSRLGCFLLRDDVSRDFGRTWFTRGSQTDEHFQEQRIEFVNGDELAFELNSDFIDPKKKQAATFSGLTAKNVALKAHLRKEQAEKTKLRKEMMQERAENTKLKAELQKALHKADAGPNSDDEGIDDQEQVGQAQARKEASELLDRKLAAVENLIQQQKIFIKLQNEHVEYLNKRIRKRSGNEEEDIGYSPPRKRFRWGSPINTR